MRMVVELSTNALRIAWLKPLQPRIVIVDGMLAPAHNFAQGLRLHEP